MDEFLKTLPSMGVGGILAYIMFTLYRKDSQAAIDQWKGQSEILATLVRQNTAAMVEMGTMIKMLHEHMVMTDQATERREKSRT